jgi:hypothetical protein
MFFVGLRKDARILSPIKFHLVIARSKATKQSQKVVIGLIHFRLLHLKVRNDREVSLADCADVADFLNMFYIEKSFKFFNP